MNDALTLCVVGAGSSYTPELVEGLLGYAPEDLPVAELRLQDPDATRLEVMTGLAQRMLERAGRSLRVRAGTELAPLLPGVDFVVTQVRVGGMAARHLDESLPLRHGVIGQETTGPGGMFKALRTIPVMLDIARTVEREAPEAFILNYTNPSGIIAEAVHRHTGARLVGLCSGIPFLRNKITELLGTRFPGLRTYCVGLNHLGFIHRFVAAGRDVSEEALEALLALAEAAEDNAGLGDPEILRYTRAVALGYVNYYYRRHEALRHAQEREQTRAEEIMGIEQEILAAAADPTTDTRPEALARRGGGGYAGVTLEFLRAIAFDLGEELVCTIPNCGAVEGLEPDAGVEVVCRVDRTGASPLPVGSLPLPFRGLVQAVKAYETLTVQAAVTRDRTAAVQALMNHPLVGDLGVCRALVDEMLAAHGMAWEG